MSLRSRLGLNRAVFAAGQLDILGGKRVNEFILFGPAWSQTENNQNICMVGGVSVVGSGVRLGGLRAA